MATGTGPSTSSLDPAPAETDPGAEPALRSKYRIVRPLQVGGTASIYLAVMRGENAFSREVVIKRPLPHLVADERARLMFIDEAHIAARLQHPNICQVLDLVSRRDEIYLVLEYLRGVDLRQLLKSCIRRQELLSPELAVWVAIEVAAGLHHSHEATGLDGRPLELVHRDVSPKNIRVTFEGSVKLIDFGIARASGRATETAAGTIKGTLGYMSPEQILGDDIDRRSDVFAFGICLFQMLTCRNPFEGANLKERVRKLTQDPIPAVRELHPGLDEEIEAIVARCLDRDIDARYPTMLDVQRDLERYLAKLGAVTQRQELVALLDRHFGATERADEALAVALNEASRTVAPIDPAARLRFPEDRATVAEAAAPPSARTGPTFSPPPSEQPTEAERVGDTRAVPSRAPAPATSAPAGAAWRLAVLALGVVSAGLLVARMWGGGVEVAPLAVADPRASPGGAEPAVGSATAAGDRGSSARSSSGRGVDAGETGSGRGDAAVAVTRAPSPESASGGRSDRASASSRGRRTGAGAKAVAELGGRARARQFFLAGVERAKRGRADEARLLYELAFEASKPRTPSSVFLNLGLLAQDDEDLARAKACFRAYVARRKSGAEVSRIRTLIATLPATAPRRCVTAAESARARRRYARAGAEVDGWIDEALERRLR